MRTDRALLAPAGLETLESHRHQRLCGVFPVSRLRPRDDEGAGRQRERFVEAKAGTFVSRPDAEVRVQEDPAAFLSTSTVRPVLGIRGHQVTAVFTQVKARFCLN